MTSALPELVKLTIEAYLDQTYKPSPERVWEAMFNPTELSFSRKNTYGSTQSVGTSAPQQSYAGGQADEIQLDLLLDGTGVAGEPGSVWPRLEALLELTGYHGENHAPYYVDCRWASFRFRGVVMQADVTYKLFDRSGEPLRATVRLALKTALSQEELQALERDESPDLYQSWLVTDDDRLDAIAARVYGDPAYWRPLAAANRLANPRALVTGQLLLLPPLAEAP